MNQVQRTLLKTLRSGNVLTSNQRFYGRWMHRNPVKVYLPCEGSLLKKEKVIDFDSVIQEKSKKAHADNLKKDVKDQREAETERKIEHIKKEITPEKSKEIKKKREVKKIMEKSNLNKKNVFDENNEVMYEKVKENDGRISTLLIKLKSRKNRARAGQVLVEGWRLIVDGLQAKCRLTHVIFSCSEDLNKISPYLPRTGVLVYKMPYKEFQLWSDVETSPGIFGVFESPTPENVKRFSKPFPINIICDNIRVPGNLGAILRAAVGVGCENVYLMKGCVDLWDPKVVRSAAGAHFRLPIHPAVDWDYILDTIDKESSVYIADNNPKQITVQKTEIDDDAKVSNKLDIDIPVIPYYSVNYGSLPSITLLIGGETEGISEDSYSFAAQRNGVRLIIPLHRGVDSLNSGMAAAVIGFEIKKQILQANAKLFSAEDLEVISQ